VADTILIPFQPRSIDLWAAAQIGAIIAEARHVNPALRAWAVLNVADPQGPDNTDAAAALQAAGIEALPWIVGRRKAFPNAFSAGLSVLEQERRDPKAVSELLSIVDALYAPDAPNVDTQYTQQQKVSEKPFAPNLGADAA
jgi:chromosome partitioning protein